jgi:predicted HicB family RNase H-like nuclease
MVISIRMKYESALTLITYPQHVEVFRVHPVNLISNVLAFKR